MGAGLPPRFGFFVCVAYLRHRQKDPALPPTFSFLYGFMFEVFFVIFKWNNIPGRLKQLKAGGPKERCSSKRMRVLQNPRTGF